MAIGPTFRWRGPGPGRPDLPLPPGPMPLWRDGGLRKRWRYVGFYGEGLMLCAARAEVGPTGQCFWALWDRERGTGARPHLAAPRQPRGRPRRSAADDRRARPPRRAASGRGEPDRIDLPERRRLGLDPQAGRGADDRPGRTAGPADRARRPRRRRRIGRLPGPPHELALVGRGRDGGRRPRPRLEPGRGHQRPARAQRARGLGRRRPPRAGPGQLRRPRRRPLRRRLPPRLRARRRALPRRQLPPRPLHLPPPLRHLHRPPRRHRAGARAAA